VCKDSIEQNRKNSSKEIIYIDDSKAKSIEENNNKRKIEELGNDTL
jgi:hypothetical protein